MKIENSDDRHELYWRVFNPDDPSGGVGLQEGFLQNGESTVFDHPQGRLKLEVKRKNLQGAPVVAFGPVYPNSVQFTFRNNQLVVDNYS